MRILIIDRQPRTRQNLKVLLDAWHQTSELREAAYVCEALHKLEIFRPETFLVDARVPDISGLKAIRSIRTEYPSFTMIVLSMNQSVKAEAIAAGADAFVNQSDPPEKLRETLRDVFNGGKRSNEYQIQSICLY